MVENCAIAVPAEHGQSITWNTLQSLAEVRLTNALPPDWSAWPPQNPSRSCQDSSDVRIYKKFQEMVTGSLQQDVLCSTSHLLLSLDPSTLPDRVVSCQPQMRH